MVKSLIFSGFKNIFHDIQSHADDRLLEQCKKFAEAALVFAGAKLNKSFHKTIIEILIL